MVFYRHAKQLWQLVQDSRRQEAHSLEGFVKTSLQFSELYYNYSPDIQKYVNQVRDSYQKEVFRNFLVNRDLGMRAFDQIGILSDHFRNQLVWRADLLKEFSRSLPHLGWSLVLTAICVYFSGFSLSESKVVASSQFFGFSVVAVSYALLLDALLVQPWLRRLKYESEVFHSKDEILKLTVHNLLAGKTTVELKKNLDIYVQEQKRQTQLKVA